MAQKKPVKRLKKGGDSKGGGGSKGGGSKGGSTQASGDGSNKPGAGGPSGGFSSAGKNLGGGGGGGNVAAPTGGGGGGGIPAPGGGGGISTPAGGFGGEALPPGVSPQVAAGALAQLTGGKVDLRGIAGVPRGPGAPLARDVLTKQGPQEFLPTDPVTTMGFSGTAIPSPPPAMTMGAPLAVPEAGVGALLPGPMPAVNVAAPVSMLDPFGPDPRLTREMQGVMQAPVTFAPSSSTPPMGRPFEPDMTQYTATPQVDPLAGRQTPEAAANLAESQAAYQDMLDRLSGPAPESVAPTPTAVPAPTPVAPTPTAVPAPTPTPAPPAAMTPEMIAADTAATAGGIPPGSRAPMGGGLLALGLNALNPLMRGSGQGLFGGGERMTADQIFAREAEMSRGGEGGGTSGPILPTPTAPEATPAPVAPAPVAPVVPEPVYVPPTPTRGYQSYFDLMRARNQPGIIPGLAGGGMVQPGMTNAFTPGSYYAAYDPRRRGLGGM
jgi:hypothetical protein